MNGYMANENEKSSNNAINRASCGSYCTTVPLFKFQTALNFPLCSLFLSLAVPPRMIIENIIAIVFFILIDCLPYVYIF